MIRALQWSSRQMPWPQLSAQLPLPCSSLLANLQPSRAQQSVWVKGYSTDTDEANEAETSVQQAARELGLDAVPLPQLREMMSNAFHRETSANAVIGVDPPPAKQKKLTYSDVQGYEQLLQSLVYAPDNYEKKMPKAPALDAGQWVDAHFKQFGYGFEPRSPFYVWRAWAAAALPPEQVETLVAMENLMADDDQRSALLKQAQHELARLWDWQHRRAALGLPMDLPSSSSSCSSGSNTAQTATSPAADMAPAAAEVSTAAAEALAATAQQDSSSSSSDDESISVPTAAATEVVDVKAKQNVLEVLESSGAFAPEQQQQHNAAQQFQEHLESNTAATAQVQLPSQWMCTIEDVVSTHSDKEKAAREKLEKRVMSEKRLQQLELDNVKRKLRDADRGRFRALPIGGIQLRQYQPVAHDDDLFLPGKPLGSAKVAAQLSDPSRTQPVDPTRVVRQAVAIAESAKHAAALAAQNPTAVLGFDSRGAIDGAEWTSMPLLDRGVLHQQKLKEEEQRLAAKPKKALPWQLLPLDCYAFDLEVRPPTQTLDLLTNYLEVKYADVLLRKDTVNTIKKQMAVAALADGSGTEFLETPPTVLTAAKTLSPAERDAVIQALDVMLQNKQYRQYRDAVLQLYCDGLVSWGELQQCWAAAQAGEELITAAEGPVTFADDRSQLFALLSGKQQFGSLSSSSSSSAAAKAAQATAAEEAAARKAWIEAGSNLQNTWTQVAAVHSSSSSSDKVEEVAWTDPVSFEEARQTWQQLLQLAGMSNHGPRFEQVLLIGSSSSSSSSAAEQLQQQLQQLQQALRQATGLSMQSSLKAGEEAGAFPEDVTVDSLDQLRQLFADPPSLEDLLQRHWEQVARKELGKNLEQWSGPAWQQLWQLLQAITQKHQLPNSEDAAASPATADVTALFDQYLKDAEAVPLTPPPYPGASRLLHWEQRIVLGPTSGQTVTSAEVKVKLSVSAAELQRETGLSDKGLQHLLWVAGSRYNASRGILSLSCDRFPTREENRRWCLEVLHRLLQEAQARHPSEAFLLSPAGAAAAQAAALQ